MKVQEIKNTNEKELPICAYGCNQKAHYLIGTAKNHVVVHIFQNAQL